MSGQSSVDEFIVGQAAATKELRRLVDILAPADSTVLIQGQTGSGKDVVARAIHALSGRKGPLISINCAKENAELVSELEARIIKLSSATHKTGQMMKAYNI